MVKFSIYLNRHVFIMRRDEKANGDKIQRFSCNNCHKSKENISAPVNNAFSLKLNGLFMSVHLNGNEYNRESL